MLIEIHAIQNHSPSNLNRDDLGAPKTCYFGGALRSRISSQCIKRSIRRSEEFKMLCGGIRTRQLARLISERLDGSAGMKKRAAKILEICGIKSKDDDKSDKSVMLVYTTGEAIDKMADLLRNEAGRKDKELALEFGKLIAEHVTVPDMALSGRMLETGQIKDTTVDAALQVAHAISTHEARPEVDYYVAADDIRGEDASAGFVDEAMFSSACFYKYFSINWETLVGNLAGDEKLAAHTVGAFIRGAATTNPTGKQNSFASHCLPDAILIEIKDSPVSYANAFADPVKKSERGLIGQSIAQMAQYINDIDTGYGKPKERFWFSPNLRHELMAVVKVPHGEKTKSVEKRMTENNIGSLDELVRRVVSSIGHDWEDVQKAVVNREVE